MFYLLSEKDFSSFQRGLRRIGDPVIACVAVGVGLVLLNVVRFGDHPRDPARMAQCAWAWRAIGNRVAIGARGRKTAPGASDGGRCSIGVTLPV